MQLREAVSITNTKDKERQRERASEREREGRERREGGRAGGRREGGGENRKEARPKLFLCLRLAPFAAPAAGRTCNVLGIMSVTLENACTS